MAVYLVSDLEEVYIEILTNSLILIKIILVKKSREELDMAR